MNEKTVLITGASAGLGRACADQLSREGWRVVGASRRGSAGDGWSGLVMDVDSDASVRDGVASVLAQCGRLDAVVACAGWGLAGAAELTSLSDAKAQLETNFWGAVRVVQASLPHLRASGAGRVVLMSSIGGLLAIPFQSFYSASKFALEGYAEALAYEVAPLNVSVTLVEPGNFKTEFTAKRHTIEASGDNPYRAAQAKAVAMMERDEVNGARPEKVATLVATVLATKKPPRRVSVGKLGERVGLVAKRLLPFALFERAARSSLGV